MAVKASRLTYKQTKIEKTEKKLKNSKNEQLQIITKEINELRTKVDSFKKVNEQFDEESEIFLFDADANPSKPHILLLRQLLEAKFGDNPLAFWIRIILAVISKTRMCFLELNSAEAKVKTNKRVCY